MGRRVQKARMGRCYSPNLPGARPWYSADVGHGVHRPIRVCRQSILTASLVGLRVPACISMCGCFGRQGLLGGIFKKAFNRAEDDPCTSDLSSEIGLRMEGYSCSTCCGGVPVESTVHFCQTHTSSTPAPQRIAKPICSKQVDIGIVMLCYA